MTIKLLYLYPNEMNFYGDTGNVLTLQRRLEWRGYDIDISYHHPDKRFDHRPDIIVGGGGQDSGQLLIYKDLLQIGSELHKLADDEVPMLMVCGSYQLFGKRFVTNDGSEMPGIGIFDAETIAGNKRLVGNIWIRSQFGELIGYENHSGETHLLGDQQPFGEVVQGYGNTGEAKTEGAVYKNVYGTYMHGSLLPRNPAFSDALLAAAIKHATGEESDLKPLDDTLAQQSFARAQARLFQ